MSQTNHFGTLTLWRSGIISLCLLLSMGCGGGSSESSAVNPVAEEPNAITPPQNIVTPTPNPTSPSNPSSPIGEPQPDNGDIVTSDTAAARILTQATFGPSLNDIQALSGESLSQWLLDEIDKPASLHSQHLDALAERYGEMALEGFLGYNTSSKAFWEHAITADDQLRQRVAFALSQIFVVSDASDDLFEDYPIAISSFQDILIENAFGNFLDLLTEVTYSPTMGRYLTYLGNRKANPATGSVPDENYAREILQLFTTGLVALNLDGTAQLDASGQPIELYNNTDITGLAKVFTGLDYAASDIEDDDRFDVLDLPMVMNENAHSTAEKTFLGFTIPASTDGATSIQLALEHIVNQPSVAPFFSRQLIQRLVTSHPEPDYVARVSSAFESGEFVLPNGVVIGEGLRGDLAATVAAVLADPDARYDMMDANVDLTTFGKVREPILRFTHWARAFDLAQVTPEFIPLLQNTSSVTALNQHPYRANSVFNFFRPGYVAPQSITGAQGLTMPELQILNASSSFGYIDFMTAFISSRVQVDPEELLEELMEDPDEPLFDVSQSGESFLPSYSAELVLANNPELLVAHLAQILFTGNLSASTQQHVIESLELLPVEQDEDEVNRVQLAILMLMTSPDYLVQQ